MSEGASVEEQLIGAARSNNETLIESIFEARSAEEVAKTINTLTTALGERMLHLACQSGSLEVVDLLLDQEGVEIDPKNKVGGSTPLHLAVEHAASNPKSEAAAALVELLIEAGATPDILDSAGKKPIDLAGSNAQVAQLLRGAQYAAEMQRSGAAGGMVDGADAVAEGEEEAEEGGDEEGGESDNEV